jgi:hypothetical protein
MKITTREQRPVVSAVAIRDAQLDSIGTDREVTRFACVEQMTELSRNCDKTASDDLFHNVASQLVRCPGHNVIDSDPSDNHGTESVCAGSDR